MFAVELKNIGKKYLLEFRERQSLRRAAISLFKKVPEKKDFWALRGIDLNIKKGEAVGVIGRNGSGKTTLLKILSKVTKPTKGSIIVNGRVVGLLELGAGFQGDLTGRENIYLNGAILGLSRREIQINIDSIIKFADIGDFINAPIRTYSSGMYLRLGFAIAIHANPDILLIDEVLTVGDTLFQKKCLERIEALKTAGKTVLFVSHNLNMIRQVCDRVILMDKGAIVCDADAESTINRYYSLMDKKEMDWLNKEIEITGVYFRNITGQAVNKFKTGENIKIVIEYFAHKKIEKPVFGIGVYKDDIYLIGPNTRDSGYEINYVEGRGAIEYKINSIPFSENKYKVSISIHNVDESCFYDYRDRIYEFQVVDGIQKIKYGIIGIENATWNKIK